MHCPNCGADLNENNVCPYCGYEDEKSAQARHQKEIDGIYEKIAKILHTPVERAHTIIFRLLVVTAAALCVFLLVLVGTSIYTTIGPDHAYENQQKVLSTLEECYRAGEYDEMNRILDGMDDSYREVYNKYTTIGKLYERISDAEWDAASYTENIRNGHDYRDLLQYPLRDLFGALNRCRELEENGFVYDEEPVVLMLTERARAVLEDMLLLTDEEICSGMEMQKEEDPDYMSLCEQIVQRVQGESS